MKEISVMCAVSYPQGIFGEENGLPWKFGRPNEDMRRFMKETKQGSVVMGRSTLFSLPPNSRPLSDRENLVLTSDVTFTEPGVTACHSEMDAIKKASHQKVCFIGGKRPVEFLLRMHMVDVALITLVHMELPMTEHTVFFQELLDDGFLYPLVCVGRERHIQPLADGHEILIEFLRYERTEV